MLSIKTHKVRTLDSRDFLSHQKCEGLPSGRREKQPRDLDGEEAR